MLIVSTTLAKNNNSKIQKQIRVAVIDTGLDPALMSKNWICKDGHKDFTGTSIRDVHGHGTHIAGLIEQYAKGVVVSNYASVSLLDKTQANFCLVIIKYFDPRVKIDNLKATIESFKWAISQKVDIINYSGGGTDFSAEENTIVLQALDNGIRVVTAAGNENSDIDKHPYYPAMYDNRIIKVGNLKNNIVNTKIISKLTFTLDNKNVKSSFTEEKTIERNIASSSNYGISVADWEVGTNVLSRTLNGNFGFMSGTSQSCAIKTGKIVHDLLK